MSNSTNSTAPLPLTNKINTGDTAWMMMSTALVFLMIPGVGYFYSGMARSKNSLSLIFLSLITLAVVGIEWFMVGYSLAISDHGSLIYGGFADSFFIGLESEVHPNAPTVPAITYAMYQGMFAAITPALAFGAAAERSRLLPAIVFLIIWSLIVYNPIAYWTWAPSGWGKELGVYDYAGGSPVHITSGMAGLAYAIRLGKRRVFNNEEFKPHSYFNIMLGTAFLWFGWFGFNGGSAGGANPIAAIAIANTNISASFAASTWALIAFQKHGKVSSFHFCLGAVAGLVVVTPAAGLVPVWSSPIFGIVGGVVCYWGGELKQRMGFDDALDVFAVHAVGGSIGNILTAVFADKRIPALVGTKIAGGWLNGHWVQMAYQLANCVASATWSFVITWLILYAMDLTQFLRIRLDEREELIGMDASQMGEFLYDVNINRDINLAAFLGDGDNQGMHMEQVEVDTRELSSRSELYEGAFPKPPPLQPPPSQLPPTRPNYSPTGAIPKIQVMSKPQ